MGDLPCMQQAGKPVLPSRPVRILIPKGRAVARVEVEAGQVVVLEGKYLVEPSQEPVPLSYQGPPVRTAPDARIYSSRNAYPPKLKSGDGLQHKGAYGIFLLTLHPVSYIPAKGELSYYKSLSVRVSLKPAGGRATSAASPRFCPGDGEWVRGRVENPGALASYGDGKMENGLSAALGSYPHVIITSQALADAPGPWNFQALRDHRVSRSLPSTIVTTEYIYANFPGTKPNGQSDNQTKIRNFIAWARANWGTQYVLLGGYSGIIPVRYLRADGTDIPADMYYGNLDGTFDNDADGVYGEPGNGPGGGEVDLYAEVYVGRACVENAAEVANFVRKTIGYETSTADYLHSAYMAGEWLGWGGDSQYATGSIEEIRTGSCAHGYCTKGFAESDFFQTSTLYDAPGYSWPKSDLITIMNSGVHVLNHLGHAYYTYDTKLYTSDLPSLTNTDYFFLYSQGCMPGGFDTPNCFGEVITTMAHGAFAAVLNACSGLGMTDSTDGPSPRYNREFWDALFGEGIRELGRMNADSKEDNDFRINDTGMRWCFYELNLFGDPAVELRSVSSRGEVSLDAVAYAIPGTVTVTVTDADLDANPASPDTVSVALTSGAEAAPESLLLTETRASTRTFRGSIQTAAGPAIPGDGILQVSDGDTITVVYHDADHGTGSPADVEDTAMADGAAPVISNVRFSASAKVCHITWDTNEPATSAVSSGTAPPPGLAKAAFGFAASHSMWITGLSPLTTYYFSVTSADAVGNSSTDTNGGAWYSFTTPEHGTIIFVDDDEGDPYHESYFTSALDAASYCYEVWDVAALGSPAAADLALYQAVVWNCGVNSYAPNAGISPTEEAALAGYMNGGGGVFLCGQDVIGYNSVSEGFLEDYLHVGNYTVNDNTTTARGIAGDPVSDGMTLPLSYTFTNFSDSLAPGAGADGAFRTDGSTASPYCAVRYPAEGASSPHRIVFFAFPFEAISSSAADPNNAKTVMDRVLCFISPVQITDVSPAYGLNDAPVTLTVTGAHFTQDLAVSFGGVTLAVPTRTPGELRAVVPAGIAAGAYDLAMTSPYGMKGVSPAAYTALVPSGDDDADGLTNRDEVDTFGTDPFLADTDEDGLSDYAEVVTHHTDPFDPDADHDGLLDGEEILWGTSTVLSDTDGDGIGDYLEVRCGDGGAAHDPGRVPAVKVNFQPSGTVCPTGYAPDITAGYTAAKGYGWIPGL